MRLSPLETSWLCLVFDTLLPRGADERLPEGAADTPMERFIDDLMGSAPLHFTLGLRASLWLVALCPLFVLGRLSLFSGLDGHERLEVFERLSRSDNYVVRELPLLFKTAACLGFCGLPSVQSRVGIQHVDATPPSWARTELPLARRR